MSTSKSTVSDSSSRASTTVTEIIQRITSAFPSSALGRMETLTDESSYGEEGQDVSRMFDPVEFDPNDAKNFNEKNFFRNTSIQTVGTEQDSAWFYSGDEGIAMEDYPQTGEPTMREVDDGTIVMAVPRYPRGENGSDDKKRHRRNRRTTDRHKEQQNKTTLWLLILCIVLTFILIVLVVVLRPFQSRNTIPNSSSNGFSDISSGISDVGSDVSSDISDVSSDIGSDISDISNDISDITDQFDPTTSPVIPDTDYPTRFPTLNPTIHPTRKPTTHPTRFPTVKPTTEPTGRPTLSPLISITPNTTVKDEKVPAIDIAVDKIRVPPLSMGPMVGHTTHDSVTLWAYHDFSNYTMEILIYDSATDGLVRTIDFVAPRKDRNNVILETIRGLEPSKSYKYGMHIQGERVGKGSFNTAPLPNNNGTKFDYILASCMNHRQYKNQIVWDAIVDSMGGKYPDFTILAGDTIYLQSGVDVTKEGVDFDRYWLRNKEQRSEPHFAEFIRNTPTYATWNNHDYGDYDYTDKDQLGKGKSLRAWESLWPNPGYGDNNTDDGIYYSYYWGDVHYIVTDDHWYRNYETENRLGSKQTEWIRDELVNSRGTFKIIVIGSDIMERGWSSDLNNIGTIVRENKINGVLFHAGDIHRNEYKQMVTGGFPYPVSQITSSGIAKVWRRPFVHIQIDTAASDPSVTAFFYGASSTADVTTWRNDPTLVCSSVEGVDRGKEHSCTETIRLSELTVKP